MRIISGYLKGRRFNPPKNLPVRPTTDFAKEALFNILHHEIDFENLQVLDLFAGTGNISLEFISRGATAVTSVEQNRNCIQYIKKVSKELEIANIHAVQSDVLKFIERNNASFDLVFADPPYNWEKVDKLPSIVLNSSLLKSHGLFILEHSRDFDFSQHISFSFHKKYGNVNFSFFIPTKNV